MDGIPLLLSLHMVLVVLVENLVGYDLLILSIPISALLSTVTVQENQNCIEIALLSMIFSLLCPRMLLLLLLSLMMSKIILSIFVFYVHLVFSFMREGRGKKKTIEQGQGTTDRKSSIHSQQPSQRQLSPQILFHFLVVASIRLSYYCSSSSRLPCVILSFGYHKNESFEIWLDITS
jgi:hypothetical protein